MLAAGKDGTEDDASSGVAQTGLDPSVNRGSIHGNKASNTGDDMVSDRLLEQDRSIVFIALETLSGGPNLDCQKL